MVQRHRDDLGHGVQLHTSHAPRRLLDDATVRLVRTTHNRHRLSRIDVAATSSGSRCIRTSVGIHGLERRVHLRWVRAWLHIRGRERLDVVRTHNKQATILLVLAVVHKDQRRLVYVDHLALAELR